jgi:4-carboxymuconolactone decarboxylase
MDSGSLEKGRKLLDSMAPGQPEALAKALEGLAPDMARYVVAFGYGEVLSRPGLDLKSRQTATVAALAAMGNAPEQLGFHMGAALAVGVAPREILEIIYIVAVFAGFPAALNALTVARRVFEERKVALDPVAAVPRGDDRRDRRDRGLAALEATSRGAGQAVLDSLADIAPDMAGFILDFSYGDVIARDILSPKAKEIAMIASAAARGTMRPQLKVHVAAGLEVGLTREEIAEVLIQMAVYAGFPAALNALFAAREVFEGR